MSCEYEVYGRELIDQNSIDQMDKACSIPVARMGALMPDAHLGYGLPIGGVLALEDAVSPYAVGVDIACRMKMTIYDVEEKFFEKNRDKFQDALVKGTVFGVGGEQERKQNHDVMDADWNVSPVTKENRDKAWKQLGTSGSGNHFAEWGTLKYKNNSYIALLTHSGSRGTGAAVCNHYSSIATGKCPDSPLAWLHIDSEEGNEYWLAMNLMGEYAAANHDVIHRRIAAILGLENVGGVENHHNFCWVENHGGRRYYVHRKGATPADKGELGIIPGSMASPAYIVCGNGNVKSLRSASHGAGRLLSRTQGKKKYNFTAVKNDLAKKGITVISAGADEVPGVYKDIDQVMAKQLALVDIIGRFDPKIVMMAGKGRAED